MDVASDIRVMEAMLKRDTASVARDFGFSEPSRGKSGTDGDGQVQSMQ